MTDTYCVYFAAKAIDSLTVRVAPIPSHPVDQGGGPN